MKKHVLIGVCGGIAAYKTLEVISLLKKQDIGITVVMTAAAREFITPLTFQSVSQNKVHTGMFQTVSSWEIEHIELAKRADLILVAPATANCIGKVAAGIADDMLTTVLMAAKAPVIFAPAMNTGMYTNPVFESNVKKLQSLGYDFIGAAMGRLACGDIGAGKLAPVQEIVDAVINKLYAADKDACSTDEEKQEPVIEDIRQDLAGKHILVTAGPTIEPIDPVRYLTNHSSGKMGFALAEAAFSRGAQVTLITGPVQLVCSQGIQRVDILSTRDMLEAVQSRFADADAVIKAAAPADYRPETVSDQKIKKSGGELSLRFVRNPDILESLGKQKKHQALVGFAAETNDVIAYATQKIIKKNLDLIVANNVSKEGAGFGRDTNIITIIERSGQITEYEKMTKDRVAHAILDKMGQYLPS